MRKAHLLSYLISGAVIFFNDGGVIDLIFTAVVGATAVSAARNAQRVGS